MLIMLMLLYDKKRKTIVVHLFSKVELDSNYKLKAGKSIPAFFPEFRDQVFTSVIPGYI